MPARGHLCCRGGSLVTLPKLSIAAKLYAIFALMATTTIALSVVAVTAARHHQSLTDEFESANAGTLNVEKVNGLIYAVVMESRGVYMSDDMKTSKIYADGILKFNEQIAKVVEDWKKSVRGDDAELFGQFSGRIAQFIDFRRELARLGTEVSPAAGRVWGDNDANRSVRKALNKDLEQLTKIYATRATRVYTEIDTGIDKTAMWLSLLAGLAVMLAAGRRLGDFAQRGQADRRNHAYHRSGRRRRCFRRRCRSASAATRSARSPARSACSSAPCAATRSSIAPFAATPKCARSGRSRCRTRSRTSRRKWKQPSPNLDAFPIRCWRLRPSSPAPPTRPRPRPRARRPLPRRPPRTCATSRRPPTSCRPR